MPLVLLSNLNLQKVFIFYNKKNGTVSGQYFKSLNKTKRSGVLLINQMTNVFLCSLAKQFIFCRFFFTEIYAYCQANLTTVPGPGSRVPNFDTDRPKYSSSFKAHKPLNHLETKNPAKVSHKLKPKILGRKKNNKKNHRKPIKILVVKYDKSKGRNSDFYKQGYLRTLININNKSISY